MSRNKAIENAQETLLLFLDADDVWFPTNSQELQIVFMPAMLLPIRLMKSMKLGLFLKL